MKNFFYFSFNKKDTVILLSSYNIVYFICCLIIKNDLTSCFLTAFLASLIILFTIIAIDYFKKESEEEIKMQEEERKIKEKLRAEYQRIFRLKQKHDLLKKIESLNPKINQNIILDVDSPPVSSQTMSNETQQKVHFNFLNGLGASRLRKNKT